MVYTPAGKDFGTVPLSVVDVVVVGGGVDVEGDAVDVIAD